MIKKIVINSNVNYKIPLSFCLESLIDKGFKNFHNVVIIKNGAKQQTSPRLVSLSTLCKTKSECKVTLIKTKLNNLDITGLNVLFQYKDHPLIKGHLYLYLPDTVTFEKNFPKKFKSLNVLPFEVRTCESPHSFVCVFDNNVIKRYKDSFDCCGISKKHIIELEMWDRISEPHLQSITTFGIRTYTQNRVYLFSADIYKKSHYRACFFYPEFGVYKWMNGNFNGKYVNIPNDVS